MSMRGYRLWTVCVLLMACNSSDPDNAPSCQQAMAHYYGAGCGFSDPDGNALPESALVADCRSTMANAPPSCRDDMDALLFCLDSVPSPAGSFEDCDCTQLGDNLLTCG